MSTYSVPTTSDYWVHIGFEPPFREFFIEVLDAEHRKRIELRPTWFPNVLPRSGPRRKRRPGRGRT